MEELQVSVEMTRKQLDKFKEQTASENMQYEVSETERIPPASPLEETRFVEVITVILQASAVSFVTWLINHWLRPKEAGVEIDLRKKPPKISKPAGIKKGWLYLIGEDGNIQHIELSEDDRGRSIVRKMLVDSFSALRS